MDFEQKNLNSDETSNVSFEFLNGSRWTRFQVNQIEPKYAWKCIPLTETLNTPFEHLFGNRYCNRPNKNRWKPPIQCDKSHWKCYGWTFSNNDIFQPVLFYYFWVVVFVSILIRSYVLSLFVNRRLFRFSSIPFVYSFPFFIRFLAILFNHLFIFFVYFTEKSFFSFHNHFFPPFFYSLMFLCAFKPLKQLLQFDCVSNFCCLAWPNKFYNSANCEEQWVNDIFATAEFSKNEKFKSFEQ